MELEVEFPLDFEASIPAAKGYSVCVCDTYIVITETKHHSVAVYDTATLELVSRFGTEGNSIGQFAFHYFYSGLCSRPAAFPGVFIADGGNGRVSENRIPSGDCVRLLGLTHLQYPCGVDANNKHIVVSDIGAVYSRVLLFSCNAVDDAAPLWVFGGARGSSSRQLNHPCGLRLSHDGSAVYVADTWNHRIIKIRVDNGNSDAVVLASTEHGLSTPMDIMQCGEGSLLAANSGQNQLMKVARDGAVAQLGTPGRGDGEFNWPSGLAFCPVNGVLVVRDNGRLQLFNVVRSQCAFKPRLVFFATFTCPPQSVLKIRNGRGRELVGSQRAHCEVPREINLEENEQSPFHKQVCTFAWSLTSNFRSTSKPPYRLQTATLFASATPTLL